MISWIFSRINYSRIEAEALSKLADCRCIILWFLHVTKNTHTTAITTTFVEKIMLRTQMKKSCFCQWYKLQILLESWVSLVHVQEYVRLILPRVRLKERTPVFNVFQSWQKHTIKFACRASFPIKDHMLTDALISICKYVSFFSL